MTMKDPRLRRASFFSSFAYLKNKIGKIKNKILCL